jgi:hypothetical protein
MAAARGRRRVRSVEPEPCLPNRGAYSLIEKETHMHVELKYCSM